MKIKVLLLGVAVVAFTFTTFAADALLSPRAAGNQTTAVTGITVAQPAPANAVLLAPRAQASQIQLVTGVASDANPALACRSGMAGSPRAVGECSSHTTMPSCMTVASAK